MLTAEGQRQAAILKSEGEAKAIATVFDAIHKGNPDSALLRYQYLQMLPQLAQGDANKVFVIPSEFSAAVGGLTSALTGNSASGRWRASDPSAEPSAVRRACPRRPAAEDPASS